MTLDTRTGRRKPLPARYGALLTPLILSLLMTFLVSGVSTLRGSGLTSTAFPLWMSAWGLSWLIAFPTLVLILPVVRRIVSAFVEQG